LKGEEGNFTFAVVAEGHLGLAKANGVFPGADAIKLFEFALLNILQAMMVSCDDISWAVRWRRYRDRC